jgi:hypothetical protein
LALLLAWGAIIKIKMKHACRIYMKNAKLRISAMAKNPNASQYDFWFKNCTKIHLRASVIAKIPPPPEEQGKYREGGKGKRKGKGKENEKGNEKGSRTLVKLWQQIDATACHLSEYYVEVMAIASDDACR